MTSRHHLTLKEKIELINDSHDSNGSSQNDNIPAFNEWFDSCKNILVSIMNEQDDDDNNSTSTEIPPKITEAMKMMQKLRLLATTQHSQIHKLISELES
ncbi:unnamed protein product [Rotaria sp. Silwood2]|nr:unnamed protein product [Rotaria sp. Silwood2]CAF3093261.1 unnamed protein product [Rotaria sp. Silwood2]CAF3369717.1 unnamed protein product [Rotaria sp. Silwood2]CAF4254284.1 unnamed protein product [Rotaria sp. Silwood2]CAF4281505.1 unnamed protein product [Rotaria sp. Silwood2]